KEVLPLIGNLEVVGKLARLIRPGLVEEYSVSMDGVRQDFLISQRPDGTSELQVRLDVAGARVEPAASGVQLVLARSGRKIAYSRLRVTDAYGKELPARMEVLSAGDELTSRKSCGNTAKDSEAVGLPGSAPAETMDGARRSRRLDAANPKGGETPLGAAEMATVTPQGRALLAVLVDD